MKTNLTAFVAAALMAASAVAGFPALAGPGHDTAVEPGAVQLTHMQSQRTGRPAAPGAMMHQGMMGHGMMGNGMMGIGMMGAGMTAQGMMGTGSGFHMSALGASPCSAEKDLTADDVKKILDGRLAWAGNKRLKVGNVTKKDDDTYIAEIVTTDNSLVERLEVGRKTGITRKVQ